MLITRFFEKQGFYLLRKHYYLPIPDEVDRGYQRESALVGVDINEEQVFKFIEETLNPYKAEFNAFPVHSSDDPAKFYLVNGSYMAIDGNVYYSLIRKHCPHRIVEIGSGNSTILAAEAIRKNRAEGRGQGAELISIEPHPSAILQNGIPELSQLIKKRVQDVDLELFKSLKVGDILFIDSTHVLRPGGDVWYEYCEILPRLASGVLVHIHDISLPKPYPGVYWDAHLYWNEQYVLQIFLTYNSRFEVIWPGNYMMVKHPEKMVNAFSPEYGHMRDKYPFSEPTAFWMKVK